MTTTTLEAPETQSSLTTLNTDETRIVPHAGGNGDNVRASWRTSLDKLKLSNTHCTPEHLQVLVDAFVFCTGAAQVRFETFCHRVDYDRTSVEQMIRGKYKPVNGVPQDIPAKFVKNTREFLDLERERLLGGRNEFIKTPTARRIWLACDTARESKTPVFLYGPSHIGKTWALENYKEQNNHGRTFYVRMTAAGGLQAMIRAIAEALRISPKQNYDHLKKAIKNALAGDTVLILDEVHLLQYTYRKESFFACMEVIREFYDHKHCGMVLCGTQLLKDAIDDAKAKELEQTLRRGVHRVQLPKAPTPADVDAVLSARGLSMLKKGEKVTVTVGKGKKERSVTEDVYELLRALARQEGLKAITERARYATKLAAKDSDDAHRKVKLSWSHFVRSHLMIEGQSLTQDDGWD